MLLISVVCQWRVHFCSPRMIPVLAERIVVCLVLQFGCVVVVLFITYNLFRLLTLLGAVT